MHETGRALLYLLLVAGLYASALILAPEVEPEVTYPDLYASCVARGECR